MDWMKRRTISPESGVVLISVLLVGVLLVAMGMAFMSVGLTEALRSNRDVRTTQVRNIAEAGIGHALSDLLTYLESEPQTLDTLSLSMDNVAFADGTYSVEFSEPVEVEGGHEVTITATGVRQSGTGDVSQVITQVVFVPAGGLFFDEFAFFVGGAQEFKGNTRVWGEGNASVYFGNTFDVTAGSTWIGVGGYVLWSDELLADPPAPPPEGPVDPGKLYLEISNFRICDYTYYPGDSLEDFGEVFWRLHKPKDAEEMQNEILTATNAGWITWVGDLAEDFREFMEGLEGLDPEQGHFYVLETMVDGAIITWQDCVDPDPPEPDDPEGEPPLPVIFIDGDATIDPGDWEDWLWHLGDDWCGAIIATGNILIEKGGSFGGLDYFDDDAFRLLIVSLEGDIVIQKPGHDIYAFLMAGGSFVLSDAIEGEGDTLIWGGIMAVGRDSVANEVNWRIWYRSARDVMYDLGLEVSGNGGGTVLGGSEAPIQLRQWHIR